MRSYFRCWHLADMGNLPDVRFAPGAVVLAN
jgi:hypothetical protein